MFWKIAQNEFRYRFRRISTHLYTIVLFLLSTWAATDGIIESGENIMLNAPYVLAVVFTISSLFGVIIVANIMGQAVYRDFEHQVDPLLFTMPITKTDYLLGRFIGGFLTTLYVFLGFTLGTGIAVFLPWANPDKFGPFMPLAYILPFFIVVLPNLFSSGAIFFTLVALTRRMLPSYIGGVLLLLGWGLAEILMEIMDNRGIAALLDPFGLRPFEVLFQYWTLAEKNTMLIPLEGALLYNRLLWMGIGLLGMALLFYRFKFKHSSGLGRESRKEDGEAATKEGTVIKHLALPPVTQSFTLKTQFSQYLKLTKRSFFEIVHNLFFIPIVGYGVFFMALKGMELNQFLDTPTDPVTYLILQVLNSAFSFIMLIIIIIYSGELVWRERDLKVQHLHDSMPLPNWVPFGSKFTALNLVCALLLGVMMVTGILTQIAQGYYQFEIGHYFLRLFGFELIDLLLFAMLAMLVHVFANNKYMGHFILILYFGLQIFMKRVGLDHTLYRYASDPGLTFSEMNGYGHYFAPFVWLKLYWAAFAVLLAVLSNLFWVRGQETHIKWRLKLSKLRLSRPVVATVMIAIMVFVSLGGFIFYNMNVVNDYRSRKDQQALSANYEKKYKQYDGIPQPRITDVYVEADIYPLERDVFIEGRYALKNKTAVPIDSVHIKTRNIAIINAMTFDVPHHEVLADTEAGYYIYALDGPLMPGDSIRFSYDMEYIIDGFQNSQHSFNQLVYNGTYLTNSYMPQIGYNADAELRGDNVREDHDLEPREHLASPHDDEARMNNFLSNDADWISFETVVSTVPEQIAIAPGYLQREWEQNGRRYFHYKMDALILHNYAFLSAEYEVVRDTWQDINIEVYHHPGHESNVDRMIRSVKKSLDYYTTHFSPYQHQQVRILEYPRYRGGASAFPNTIPFSEAAGFIAKVGEDDLDAPFLITAHEMGHQWWAHQVVGANVPGSPLLSETMAQYSAMMVAEDEYGPEKMRKFLAYMMDLYFLGRASEQEKELPLLHVENQPYIYYRKGAVVMYALKDYIGEDSLNTALSRYIQDVAFQASPYTNSAELLSYIRAVTPDSLQYILHDLFETITLYKNRMLDASYTAAKDGKYTVDLTLLAAKLRADSLGNEVNVPIQDWIDIGVFAEEEVNGKMREVPLYLRKHQITQDTTRITIRVDKEPIRAGIDPYYKLIDRNKEDNVKAVDAETDS